MKHPFKISNRSKQLTYNALRRFNVLDRAIQKARQEIMVQEDEAIFKALDDASKDCSSLFDLVYTYKDN